MVFDVKEEEMPEPWKGVPSWRVYKWVQGLGGKKGRYKEWYVDGWWDAL